MRFQQQNNFSAGFSIHRAENVSVRWNTNGMDAAFRLFWGGILISFGLQGLNQ
jgi:hypothetical protein